MPQQTTSQELTSSSFTTGFATGTTCTRTGSYKASNNYLQAIVVVVKGNKFPNFTDGKKTTWYALSSSGTSTTSDSGFTSVTAQAGAA
jgi:hypothetical protein